MILLLSVQLFVLCPIAAVLLLSVLSSVTKAESPFITGFWEENVFPVSILVS